MNTGALVGRALSARLYRIYGWYALGVYVVVLAGASAVLLARYRWVER